MKKIGIAVALLVLAFSAAAQDRDPERGEGAREAYRRGYDEGYDRGYRKGLEEGERRAREAAPPSAPAAPLLGPIHVTGAFYGTSSRNCNANRYVAQRANGKRYYSFEVTNDICGDPAHGDRKSLEVSYRCGDVAKTASANEHRTIYLDCRS